MRYLFFISKPYGYAIVRPLQEAIRKQGDEVAWFTHGMPDHNLRNDEQQLKTVTEVKHYQPDAVFVCGNWVPDFFPGVKVQIFHGFGIDKKGHFRIRGFFDLYCTHGPLTTQPFQAEAKKHGYFHVTQTGWPKIDPLFQTGVANTWRKDHNIEKPIILYAPTFSPALTSATQLINEVARLATDERWHWVIKFHPKMDAKLIRDYKELTGPNLTIAQEPDILPLLKAADVMLADTSSVVAEFLLLEKPVVTFRTKSPGPHVLDIQTSSELEAALIHALKRPQPLLEGGRDYANAMHPYRDDQSSERVLQATKEFIERYAGKLKRKPLNLTRKIKARKALAYYHWR